MLEEYTFEQERLDGVFYVMQQVATFLPDDKTPMDVMGIIQDATNTRDLYVTKFTVQSSKLAAFHTALAALHDACTSVHASMRSRYRTDRTSLEQIEKLPVQDQTIGETKRRAELMIKVWKLLPLPPGAPVQPGPPPHYFIPYDGMTTTVLEGLMTDLTVCEAERKTADAEFEQAEAQLHAQERTMHDFNVAASAQGRAQFPNMESIEREMIESIPEEPPVSAPAPAVVESWSPTGTGALKLKAASARATKFDWQKLDGGGLWQDYALDVPLSILIATGLPLGVPIEFRVRGKNSRGTTDWSDPATVTL